ncbi:MAG: cupin domain-containing protein [Rhodospirillales bacterium]|jgi:quercetin dioxygenase-like cupin family protein|nr:cupin domain-containing protein [Rhodospirillales bacterium]MDP6804810.1 cupin domain-containing protein [Rhodospirillales bacterium]
MVEQAKSTVQIDNDRIRVTEWKLAPGSTTGYHRHEYDYVAVPLNAGKLRIVGPDGQESISERPFGEAHFGNAGVEHDVFSASDQEYAFLEIEIK